MRRRKENNKQNVPAKCRKPAPKQVEQGLTDDDWGVRRAWARRTDYVPTPAQVERGLTDDDWLVRAAWTTRTDYVPTPAQVDRGKRDKVWVVRALWRDKERRRRDEQLAVAA